MWEGKVVQIEKKNYSGLDLYKFIAAIMVVTLHANPFKAYAIPNVILREIITPTAVPFFFAASGFLWYRTYTENKVHAKNRIVNIFRLYFIWSIIYFPFVIVRWLTFEKFSMQSIGLFAKNVIFEGSYQTIWFLNALGAATFFVYMLLKRAKITTAFSISLPFYVFSCLLSSWHGLLIKSHLGVVVSNMYYSFFDTTKNGLLFGFTYVAMGGVLYELSVSLSQKKLCFLRRVLLASGLFALIGEWLLRTYYFGEAKGCDITFSLLPVTAGGILYAINCKFKERSINNILRKMSTLMFLIQRIPLTLFSWGDVLLYKATGNYVFTANPPCYFMLILGSTVLLSLIILFYSKRLPILKKIY